VSTLTERRQALLYVPVSGGVTQRSITDSEAGDLEPSFDPRGDRIVFSSSRAGNRNLWLARPDGSEARPLTSGSAFDERPVFSPDGRQIAFVSDRSGQRGIWIISAEGGAPRLLTAAVALDTLTWSRDARRVVYAVPGGDLPHLVSVSVIDGTTEPILTPGPGVAPAWSPTADVIAYLEPATLPAQDPSSTPAATLWLAFVDTHGRRRYPNLPKQSFSNGFVAWAPDGRRLAAVWNPASGVSSIWIVEPEGREPLKKLADLPSTVRPRGITWTGDGAGVIIAQQESVSDIVLFELSHRDH
jgi:Tol biopolymer transport system component